MTSKRARSGNLRIAMLTQRYLPFIGGAENQLAAVLTKLPDYGIDATVITRRHDPSLPAREMVNGIPVHRLDVHGPRVIASLTYTAKAIWALHNFRPDVVHAFELLSPATTAVAYKSLTGVPVVAKVLRGGVLGDIAALKQSAIGRMRLKRLLRSVDCFAVISKEIDDELAAEGVAKDRRYFLPNGVDLTRYQPVDPDGKMAMRAKLGLPNAPIALFAARLEPEKCIDQLVSLWPRVRDVVPNATLVVAGAGALEQALKAAAVEGVMLVGRQTNLPEWYAAADAFVQPSVAEGLSNSLLEAMAMALPCISTRVGEAPDLLANDVGVLVDVKDDEALFAGLTAVLSRPEDFASGALRGRQRVIDDFSLDVTVKRFAALYRSLSARH